MFPMAERVSGPTERVQLEAALERIGKKGMGEGFHERCLAPAGELEAMTKEWSSEDPRIGERELEFTSSAAHESGVRVLRRTMRQRIDSPNSRHNGGKRG